jgi:hypothetical protein
MLSGSRTPGEFDNAALDGIHQGEIAHSPGEQGAFHIPGTAEKKRGGGQVYHPPDFQFPVHGFQAADPQPGRVRGYPPVIGAGDTSPFVHFPADCVDQCGMVVFLLIC